MITRCSSHSLKFSNEGKLMLLYKTLDDYQAVLSAHIKDVIASKSFSMISKPRVVLPEFTAIAWLQISHKAAVTIVQRQLKSVKQRTYKKYKKLYSKCSRSGKHQKFLSKRFSELKIDHWKRLPKTTLNNTSVYLDQRIADFKRSKTFGEFIKIKLPYQEKTGKKKAKCLYINVPIKETKVSNKFKDWSRKKSIKIHRDEYNVLNLCKFYETVEVLKKTTGISLGVDRGYKKLLACSDRKTYGNFENLYKKIANAKRGSKRYKKLLKFRNNETNRAVNALVKEHPDVSKIIIEDLLNIKFKTKLSRSFVNKLQYWRVALTTRKLESLAETEGFELQKVDPAYTSQTCSICGFIHINNRSGELFKCLKCGMKIDADINASINILNRGGYDPPVTRKQEDLSF